MILVIMKMESVNVNLDGEVIIVIYHVYLDFMAINVNQNVHVQIHHHVIISLVNANVHQVEPVTDVSPFVHRVVTDKIVNTIVLVMVKIKSARQKVVIVHVQVVGLVQNVIKNALLVDGVLDVNTFVNVIIVIPLLVLVHVHQV